MSPRKIRSDCRPINELDDTEQQQLFGWIKAMGFEKARLLAIKEFDRKFSIGSLHTAFHHWSEAESENRIFQAVTGADTILDAAGDNLGKLDEAMAVALKTATFQAIMAGAEPKTIKSFSNILLKTRALDQAEQTLELRLRQYEDQINAAKAELGKAKADGGMTPEAIEKMEEALGML